MITRDTVIRIGRRYGCVVLEDGPDSQCEIAFSADQLVALLEFVALCEREACAKLCGELHLEGEDDTGLAADMIRARGETI